MRMQVKKNLNLQLMRMHANLNNQITDFKFLLTQCQSREKHAVI